MRLPNRSSEIRDGTQTMMRLRRQYSRNLRREQLVFSEAGARERYGDVRTFRTNFRPMKQILLGDELRVMMKVVVRAANDRVLGCI